MRLNNRTSRYLILGFILLNGLLLRITGLEWGIPRAPYWKSYHPDESVALSTVLKMSARDGNLNPHYFVNPTFHYYLIGAAWWLAGSLKIMPSAREIMDESPTVELDKTIRIWLLSRMISVVLGVMTIWLVYLLGRHLQLSPGWALLGAWLAAVMPTLVVQSHYLTVDGPAGFWFIMTLLLLLRAYRKKNKWGWALAGLVGGVAAATKYNVLAGIIPAAVCLMIWQVREHKAVCRGLAGRMAILISFMMAGFLLGCPYALLSFGEWREGITGLLQYNDYPTNWLFPWLVTSRLSLGWPGWVLFLSSWAAVVVKPDKAGVFLASSIILFFIIYGYKASPFMRHMVPVVPLTLVLMVYAMNKALGYLRKPAFMTVAVTMVLVSSGYAMANSLAWVRTMSGQDTREEAAEYIKRKLPLGSDIGLAGRLWFYTPPLAEEQFNLVRLDYHPASLERANPKVVVVSEYEEKQFAFCLVPPEVRDDFFRALNEQYRVAAVFSRVPRCCGLEFKGYPLADWNYFYPQITIYERFSQ